MSNSQLGVELEQKQLLATIANIERNMAIPASREVSSALLTYLNSLKTRLGVLEEKQKEFEAEKQRTESLQRVAALVEREAALSSAEREQYRSFLEKEHFTKADFASLENFYSHTWDRLTEGGKEQMSHRVWEGVRREEYRFSELPETVKEKEAQRLREAFRTESRERGHLSAIPERDRSDFIEAWDDGRKRDSYQVLDRQSFTKSVSLSVAAQPGKTEPIAEVRQAAVVRNEEKISKPDTLSQSIQAKASRQDLILEELSDISLTAADVKPPLDNHKKPGSTPARGQ